MRRFITVLASCLLVVLAAVVLPVRAEMDFTPGDDLDQSYQLAGSWTQLVQPADKAACERVNCTHPAFCAIKSASRGDCYYCAFYLYVAGYTDENQREEQIDHCTRFYYTMLTV